MGSRSFEYRWQWFWGLKGRCYDRRSGTGGRRRRGRFGCVGRADSSSGGLQGGCRGWISLHENRSKDVPSCTSTSHMASTNWRSHSRRQTMKPCGIDLNQSLCLRDCKRLNRGFANHDISCVYKGKIETLQIDQSGGEKGWISFFFLRNFWWSVHSLLTWRCR